MSKTLKGKSTKKECRANKYILLIISLVQAVTLGKDMSYGDSLFLSHKILGMFMFLADTATSVKHDSLQF